jgi:hypothetical protein
MRPAFYLLLAATLSFGQSANTPIIPSQVMTAQRLEELVLYQMERDPATDQAKVQRRQAAFEDEEFCRRANRVAELWGAVMNDHYDGRVNVKRMHELSKAFHELEKSGGWVAGK